MVFSSFAFITTTSTTVERVSELRKIDGAKLSEAVKPGGSVEHLKTGGQR